MQCSSANNTFFSHCYSVCATPASKTNAQSFTVATFSLSFLAHPLTACFPSSHLGDCPGFQLLLRNRDHPQPHVQEGGGRAAQEQALKRTHDVSHEGGEDGKIRHI
jgi:hypothetical protein